MITSFISRFFFIYYIYNKIQIIGVLGKKFNKSLGGADAVSNLNLVGDSFNNEIKR